MDPSVRFIDDIKPMLESNLQRVRGVEGVKWAVPLYKGNGRAKLIFTPAELKEKTYPPRPARARPAGTIRPPANPFTRVLDLVAPGIDSATPPPARWYDNEIINVIEQVILLGVDDTSLVERRRGSMIALPPERADAGGRARRPAPARFRHRRPRWPAQALPGLPPR